MSRSKSIEENDSYKMMMDVELEWDGVGNDGHRRYRWRCSAGAAL
jgi:hypothetical protein